MKNLGIFAVSVALIFLVVLLYFAIKWCARSCSCCLRVKGLLAKKIFYNGPLRYVIVGYLKLFNQFVTLLFLAYANDQGVPLVVGYGCIVAFLTLWPLWTEYFLIKNQSQLKDKTFFDKFASLYQGINTKSFGALCYNAVFAVRRFDLVLLNVYFTQDSPLSRLDRTMYLFKIIGFLTVQTFYVAYVHETHPHEEPIFNKVELVNEYALIALGYVMLNYIKLSPQPSSDGFETAMEYIAVGIIAVMVVVNFGVMIKMSLTKIIAPLRRKKLQKQAREQMALR